MRFVFILFHLKEWEFRFQEYFIWGNLTPENISRLLGHIFFFFVIYNFYPGSGSGYACSSPTASILHVVLVQISVVKMVMPSY